MSGPIRLFATLSILVFVTSACASISAPERTATPEPPHKILIVGNSEITWNLGVDYHLEQLAASANPPLVIEVDSVVKGGASLEYMWERSKACESIAEGGYDVVVLQENNDTDVDMFREYARKFGAEIKEAGAELVLSMDSPPEERGWSAYGGTCAGAPRYRTRTGGRRCTGRPG